MISKARSHMACTRCGMLSRQNPTTRSPPRSARSFADERPPDGLEQRLAQSVRTLPSPARVTSLLRRFAGMVAAAVLISVFAVILLGPDRAELADVPLKELQAFIDSNRPVDVATNDPVRVRNWLA